MDSLDTMGRPYYSSNINDHCFHERFVYFAFIEELFQSEIGKSRHASAFFRPILLSPFFFEKVGKRFPDSNASGPFMLSIIPSIGSS